MKKTNMINVIILLFITLTSIETKAQTPLFPNSVVSNDIDFIRETDPDVFESLTYIGLDNKEMPNSGSEILFDENTFVFEATFTTGVTLEIWCHSSFLTVEAAQEYAEKLCPRLGKLPDLHRDALDHVVIHNGDAGAFAEIDGNFFILYSENMDARISTNDLEETVFHEAVHASIQEVYATDSQWTDAQDSDFCFVTEYGEDLPDLEDMAESALFAYTYLKHPGRLSAEIESWLFDNIPNRLAFFCAIYPFCETSTIPEVSTENVSVHPNPAKDEFTVTLEEVEKESSIKIYSVVGTLVKSSKAIKGQNSIEIDDLSKGVYLLSVPGFKTTRIVKV